MFLLVAGDNKSTDECLMGVEYARTESYQIKKSMETQSQEREVVTGDVFLGMPYCCLFSTKIAFRASLMLCFTHLSNASDFNFITRGYLQHLALSITV